MSQKVELSEVVQYLNELGYSGIASAVHEKFRYRFFGEDSFTREYHGEWWTKPIDRECTHTDCHGVYCDWR